MLVSNYKTMCPVERNSQIPRSYFSHKDVEGDWFSFACPLAKFALVSEYFSVYNSHAQFSLKICSNLPLDGIPASETLSDRSVWGFSPSCDTSDHSGLGNSYWPILILLFIPGEIA